MSRLNQEDADNELDSSLRKRRGNKQRGNKRSSNKDDDDYDSKSNSSRKRLQLQRRSTLLNNPLVVGLTFSVGIAAVAMYAMSSANKDPQDLISRVFQLLTY